jgi:NADP-dependent 3-hydroxy acid dehydrogenase YdfG
VRKPNDVKQPLGIAFERFGCFNCLINNSGLHPPFEPIDEYSVEQFRELLVSAADTGMHY